jgi:ABC-type long-subunit fatty acid transport system fused permease/ATPase subunit
MKFKEFLKENKKGFIISSLTIIFGYPLLYIFQFQKMVSLESFLMVIPFAFISVFILMCLFGLVLEVKSE